MSLKTELEAHLRKWKGELQSILPSSKDVWFPDRFVSQNIDAKTNRYHLPEPICFGSLPLGNANSRKEHRIWAFVEGHFESKSEDTSETLTMFGASVVFFEAKSRARRFRLVDAFHFDYHLPETSKTSPHPLFHLQRNLRWDEKRWRSALSKVTYYEIQSYRFPDFHLGIKSSLFRLQRFRMPTARLDLFAVLLAMVADMVVKHDVQEHCDIFDGLVDLMESDKNPLHKLACGYDALPKCFPHTSSSAGSWYPLYRNFPVTE